MLLLYILTFVLLAAVEVAYLPIARRNHWTTERNRRADGHPVTPIGGGVVFYVAMVVWAISMSIIYRRPDIGGGFIIGLTMLAACSFADDLLQLKVWIRLVVQFVAVIFLGLQCMAFHAPILLWPAYILCAVAFINAYNFMDGINGITAAYSLVVLGVFLYIDQYVMNFISGSLLIMALGAVVVFGFFNFRQRARVFAGDVGSISMGFIICYALVSYILARGSLTAIIFVSVYGVDTFITVVRRAAEGENILRSHRKHIYQLLTGIWHVGQLKVATGYALLQLAISACYLYFCTTALAQKVYFVAVVAALTGLYFILMIASEARRLRDRRRRESLRAQPYRRSRSTRRRPSHKD